MTVPSTVWSWSPSGICRGFTRNLKAWKNLTTPSLGRPSGAIGSTKTAVKHSTSQNKWVSTSTMHSLVLNSLFTDETRVLYSDFVLYDSVQPRFTLEFLNYKHVFKFSCLLHIMMMSLLHLGECHAMFTNSPWSLTQMFSNSFITPKFSKKVQRVF